MKQASAIHLWLEAQGLPSESMEEYEAILALMRPPLNPLSSCPRKHRYPRRVLMLLCQKPQSTGSGIVTRELIERLPEAGFECALVYGSECSDEVTFTHTPVYLRAVQFSSDEPNELPFAIAGMSNGMPYPSRTFHSLTLSEVSHYVQVWGERIQEAIDTFDPDVIHVHHLWLLAALAAIKSDSRPIVVSVHGTDLDRAEECPHLKTLVQGCIHRFNKIFLLTRSSQQVIQRLYHVPRGAMIVLGNGFNETRFHPIKPDPVVLKRYNIVLEHDEKIILTLAKYDRWKGIQWLIMALGLLLQDLRENCSLIIAGSGPDAQWQEYVNLAKSLGISQRLFFTGAVSNQDVPHLLSAAHVFALPSFNEPFGLAILEALACGIRVVSTNQGGPSEFVPSILRHSEDALLVDGLSSLFPKREEEEQFVANISLSLKRQLEKSYSDGDHERISKAVKHMSWKDYVVRLVQSYNEAIEDSQRSS